MKEKDSTAAILNDYHLFSEKAQQLAFQTLFKNLVINFYWTDKEGRLLGCNQEELAMLGVSSLDEVVGKHAKDLFSTNSWLNSKEVLEQEKTLIVEETPLYS